MRSRYLLAPLLLLATVCMQQAHGQADLDSPKKADPDPAAVHQTVLQVKQAYVATTSAVVASQDPEASAKHRMKRRRNSRSSTKNWRRHRKPTRPKCAHGPVRRRSQRGPQIQSND